VTRSDARDIIRRHDPALALRIDRVDPLPLPCDCPDPDTVDIRTAGQVEPIARLCTICGRTPA
jgi:hypothetical protein